MVHARSWFMFSLVSFIISISLVHTHSKTKNKLVLHSDMHVCFIFGPGLRATLTCSWLVLQGLLKNCLNSRTENRTCLKIYFLELELLEFKCKTMDCLGIACFRASLN